MSTQYRQEQLMVITKNKQTKEREFHNKVFSGQTRQGLNSFYSVLRASRLYFEEMIFGGIDGAQVLEYGCGEGTYSVPLATRGANVTGIDISDFAIEQAIGKAKQEQLGIEYIRMDAEQLEFENDRFDLVCGVAILHHLDLDKAFTGLARVLKPGGHAVFMEPLGHNPAINLYRALTPHLRTDDERPLLMSDLRIANKYFEQVDNRFFTFQTLLAVPFRRMPFFIPMVKFLDTADKMLFTVFPPARRLAWQVIIVLTKPHKAETISQGN